MFSGGKFKVADLPSVRRPEVSPPILLLLVIPFCTILLVGMLLYFVSVHIALGNPYFSLSDSSVLVVGGGILPIVVTWAIATNRSWSNYLVILQFFLIPWIVHAARPGFLGGSIGVLLWAILMASIGLAVTSGTKRSRAYYRAISGKVVTEEDLASLTYSTRWRNLVHRFAEVGPALELIAVILVLGTVAFAFLSSSIG